MGNSLDEFYKRLAKRNAALEGIQHFVYSYLDTMRRDMAWMNTDSYTEIEFKRAQSAYKFLYQYARDNVSILTDNIPKKTLADFFGLIDTFGKKIAQVSARFVS